MKPRSLIVSSVIIVGFLGYKLWGSESVEGKPPTLSHPSDRETTVEDASASVEDLEPVAKPKTASLEVQAVPHEEDSSTPETSAHEEIPQEPMVNPETGIIKVKVPIETQGKPGIVNLVQSEQDAAPPEREKLDNPAASFEEGKDAVKIFGDGLNAINGSYSGELQREGKEPCPLSLIIDGLYSPIEGAKAADFTGHFVMSYDCPGEAHSKGTFDSQFGSHVKALGDNANTLLLKDGGDTYFQLSFSNDFQKVMGHAYQTPKGGQASYAGKISAHR